MFTFYDVALIYARLHITQCPSVFYMEFVLFQVFTRALHAIMELVMVGFIPLSALIMFHGNSSLRNMDL